MPVPIGLDNLNFKNDPAIMSQLGPSGKPARCSPCLESLVYSTKVLKFNRFGMKQERNLILTTHLLANIKRKEFQRKIRINTIRALSRSTIANDFDFIVHVKDEYDYRFICEDREKLFTQIKAVYFNTCNKNLPIYDVPESLQKYATSKKDSKNNQEKTPPDSMRNYDEDIYEPIEASMPPRASNASNKSTDDEDLKSYTAKASYAKDGNADVSLNDFKILKVIGRGSFGKVFLVQKISDE